MGEVCPISLSMRSWMLQVVPFVLVAVFGGVQLAAGPRWGLLALVAVGPALAATLGGVRLVLAVGAEALVICALFAAVELAGSQAYHRALNGSLVIIGVTAGGCLARAARARRGRDLAKGRTGAGAGQEGVP